jgi:hypothetical protein
VLQKNNTQPSSAEKNTVLLDLFLSKRNLKNPLIGQVLGFGKKNIRNATKLRKIRSKTTSHQELIIAIGKQT